jgi:hypothetical protein
MDSDEEDVMAALVDEELTVAAAHVIKYHCLFVV